MNAPTNNVQIIKKDGVPIFAVLPYQDYIEMMDNSEDTDTMPQQVAEKAIMENIPLIKSWRLYLNLTQKEVAQRAGITQAALSQMERKENTTRTATLQKLAAAMSLSIEQVRD